MNDNLNLEDDSVSLVTGASRGIGKAVALRLAHLGYTVIGTATSDAGANAITESIKSIGGKGRGAVLDVTNQAQSEDLVSTITTEFGSISVLINNAGVTEDNLLLRMKKSQWDNVVNTNLNSIFSLTKICLKGMTKKRFGRIISISSVVGATGNPGQTNYAATKAGMMGFTKSLAHEVASRGITVNAIAPGFIATDMTDEIPDAHKTKLIETIPQRRLGQPEDIAHAVEFLTSDGKNIKLAFIKYELNEVSPNTCRGNVSYHTGQNADQLVYKNSMCCCCAKRLPENKDNNIEMARISIRAASVANNKDNAFNNNDDNQTDANCVVLFGNIDDRATSSKGCFAGNAKKMKKKDFVELIIGFNRLCRSLAKLSKDAEICTTKGIGTIAFGKKVRLEVGKNKSNSDDKIVINNIIMENKMVLLDD